MRCFACVIGIMTSYYFTCLDEAEVRFPFQGMVELTDPESSENMVVDADAARRDYVAGVDDFSRTLQAYLPASGNRLRTS